MKIGSEKFWILRSIATVLFFVYCTAYAARTVTCQTTAQITAALADAQPGDHIIVKAGTYTSSGSTSISMPAGTVTPWFFSQAEGTKANPVIFESEDRAHPAVLEGGSINSGYVFWLTGDYWEIRNFEFRTAQKGVVLDSASNCLLRRLDVHNVGDEGIHLRNGSSYCVVESCSVHETGLVESGYGEGVYIGSDNGKWDVYNKDCNFNTITGCVLGPHVTAEHLDIKEGTLNTVVEYCTFHGTGISGSNSADGFIDAKGNNDCIRYNAGYRENNSAIANAFQVHQQVAGWGIADTFIHNTVYLDTLDAWVVDAPTGMAIVGYNTRVPGGNMYRGKFTKIDMVLVGNYYTWDTLIIYTAGDTVYWNGHIWAAKYYNVGAKPGQAASWLDLGVYSGVKVFPYQLPRQVAGIHLTRYGIQFILAKGAFVSMDILSLDGKRLFNHGAFYFSSGWQQVLFPSGNAFAPGLYLLRISSDGKELFRHQLTVVY
jgi:hypothetical protein